MCLAYPVLHKLQLPHSHRLERHRLLRLGSVIELFLYKNCHSILARSYVWAFKAQTFSLRAIGIIYSHSRNFRSILVRYSSQPSLHSSTCHRLLGTSSFDKNYHSTQVLNSSSADRARMSGQRFATRSSSSRNFRSIRLLSCCLRSKQISSGYLAWLLGAKSNHHNSSGRSHRWKAERRRPGNSSSHSS